MSFSADWLALRAEADRAARDPGLAGELAEAVFEHDSLRVLDLGSGTGANLAAVAPLLGPVQHWTLADSDPALLDRVAPPEGITVEPRVFDLAGDLARLFDPAPDLVTASAFFDLCGAAIINDLVARTVRTRAIFYTVLTYDGREEWTPSHPSDDAILNAFHADQRRDKGLGPALGPDATAHLVHAFRAAGYMVETAASDWQLEQTGDSALIAALARGTADAVAPALGQETAENWRRTRTAAEMVMIGHQDLLALPRPA